uniref:Uncharacterized protein n=1 Tax=Magnetococcus massalia (strain MO-1) TaxID=451514 RepID=A0A1S7LMQ0_MAGMO|nr:Protein of unknown function [Candidatus Magnetococcus massalia]
MDKPQHRRRPSKKVFPPCTECSEQKPFTWNCGCGYAVCNECLKDEALLVKTKWNGRTWACPQCGLSHMGPNR